MSQKPLVFFSGVSLHEFSIDFVVRFLCTDNVYYHGSDLKTGCFRYRILVEFMDFKREVPDSLGLDKHIIPLHSGMNSF